MLELGETMTDQTTSDGLGLPEPAFGWLSVCGDDGRWRESATGERAFDAKQMRAYAAQQVAAERERCLHLARYALSCARNKEWAAADDALDRFESADEPKRLP